MFYVDSRYEFHVCVCVFVFDCLDIIFIVVRISSGECVFDSTSNNKTKLSAIHDDMRAFVLNASSAWQYSVRNTQTTRRSMQVVVVLAMVVWCQYTASKFSATHSESVFQLTGAHSANIFTNTKHACAIPSPD